MSLSDIALLLVSVAGAVALTHLWHEVARIKARLDPAAAVDIADSPPWTSDGSTLDSTGQVARLKDIGEQERLEYRRRQTSPSRRSFYDGDGEPFVVSE